MESVQRIVEKSIDSSATLTPWIWAPRCPLSKTTKKMTKKVERRHGRPSELGQKRRCRCCFRDAAAAAAASGQGGSASPRGGPRRTASWIFGGGGLLERGEKEDSFEEEKVIFLLLSQRRLLPSLELSFFSVRRRHQRNKKWSPSSSRAPVHAASLPPSSLRRPSNPCKKMSACSARSSAWAWLREERPKMRHQPPKSQMPMPSERCTSRAGERD